MAISAIKSYIKRIFFCKKIYHDVVVHVPSFQLSAKSSSFLRAFFLHSYGVLFLWTPYINNSHNNNNSNNNNNNNPLPSPVLQHLRCLPQSASWRHRSLQNRLGFRLGIGQNPDFLGDEDEEKEEEEEEGKWALMEASLKA